MAQKRKFGNLHQVLVRDSKQNIIGCYLYYLNTQGVGEVIQITSKRSSIGDVLDHLFYHAWQNGAMALHGRVEPRFIQNFWEKSCFFDRGGDWTLIHSNRPEIEQAILSGNAFLTRLEGDWWLSSLEV